MALMINKGELVDHQYIHQIQNVFDNAQVIRKGRGKNARFYYNLPCSYDIETSSWENTSFTGDEKVSITYSHALNIDGYCFLARTWDDFTLMIDSIVTMANTSLETRLVIYIHNLSYEFQFLKSHLSFKEVFSNGDSRKILYAVTTDGIEFRDSLVLSGYNLANTAKNLNKYKISKMEGDLDYRLIRTPLTPLSDKELLYILNDVVIIEYLIREMMDECGDITKIPFTNTGFVRRYCRDNTVKVSEHYKTIMNNLRLEKDEYLAARYAFGGGFTHANYRHSRQILYFVGSKDLSSSYPAVMLEYEFPMGKGEQFFPETKEEFFTKIRHYSCIFFVEFKGLICKANEAYLSRSKAVDSEGVVANNGRVDSAISFSTWMTEVDFKCVQMSYDIDDFNIRRMYVYKKDYLPKEFTDCILKLYADKTTLKNVEESVAEYMRSKGMINATFGMMVMDIIRESFEWDDNQNLAFKKEVDIQEMIDKENNSFNRFLFYPWGVFVTAYARFNLFREIIRLGDLYVYSDTDSIKYIMDDEHTAELVFKEANERITNMLYRFCDHYGYDYDVLRPKDIKGNEQMLGLWDDDGQYTRFKTLGAKRYMFEKWVTKIDKEGNKTHQLVINITVSGVNKKTAMPYLIKTYGKGKDIFDAFDEGLLVPEGHCGKLIHSYIDDMKSGTIRDYQGRPHEYLELSAVHLQETSYYMSIPDEYSEFLEQMKAGA